MKRLSRVTAVAFLLTCSLFEIALAEETAHYTFASAQSVKVLAAAPGEETRGTLYFYNVDGNRVTHVHLRVLGAPDGWEVSLNPPAAEAGYKVDGQAVSVVENLSVEPTELLANECRQVPQAKACIPVPGRGFAVAHPANLVIKVPADAPLGQAVDLRVAAEASWLGQTGAAIVKQTRDFDFTIVVARTSGPPVETKIVPTPGPDLRLIGALAAMLALGLVVAGQRLRRGRRQKPPSVARDNSEV
ncbi:MAG: hypothetical protein ACYC4L_12235 [Chloroflexota bacterium]